MLKLVKSLKNQHFCRFLKSNTAQRMAALPNTMQAICLLRFTEKVFE